MNAATSPTATTREAIAVDRQALVAAFAPTGPIEPVLVAQLAWAAEELTRMINDAPDEADRDWQRYFTLIDRVFHRNLRLLEQRRKREAAAAAPQAVQAPAPAQTSPAPVAAPPRRPEPIAWPKARPARPIRPMPPKKGVALLESLLAEPASSSLGVSISVA